jgi:phospholipase/carboxylesterase
MTNTTDLECKTIEPDNEATACVIWLHGLGASGDDLAPLGEQLKQFLRLPARYIFPNAPMRAVTLNGGVVMPAWYDIVSLDPAKPQDEAGINASCDALIRLIEQEIARGIKSERIIIAGFSQGGAIALHTGLHYKQTLAGMMGLSTYLPLHEQFGTRNEKANHNTPIFMAHGSVDDVLPMQFGLMSKTVLEAHHYPIEWHTYNMAHAICPEEIMHIAQWLKARIG